MYADDLCSIIEGANVVTIVGKDQHAMIVFAKFSGQILNPIACGIVVKPAEQSHIEVTIDKRLLRGIPIVESIKYLGVRMGNVSPDSAFAFPLGEAQRTANCITAYGLSMTERIHLLKTSILFGRGVWMRGYILLHPSPLKSRKQASRQASTSCLRFGCYSVLAPQILR